MSRPLVITDCDEVLLHMLVPFRAWLDEAHDVHFDFRRQDFGEALRHKDSDLPLERELVWALLREFFDTQMHRQYPIAGAVDAITRLSQAADIVVLTNITEAAHAGRIAQLRDHGLTHPVYWNQGGKGRKLASLVAEYRPSVTLFIDDLEGNHGSVARHAPDVWRLHMVGEPEIAGHVSDTAHAHARIDSWTDAEPWISARLAEAVPAPPVQGA